MGREMKFALIVGGSMILGAIGFAVKTHREVVSIRRASTPPAPAARSVSQELDSLSQATQAPPPAAPDYSPTWIPREQGADSSVRQGSTATLSADVPSDDSAPGASDREGSKPSRASAPAYQPPDPEPPAESTPPPNATPSTANPNPSNNDELRQFIRRGK